MRFLLIVFLSIALPILAPAPARAAGELPPARALALPRWAFPAHASITGSAMSREADANSLRLHTLSAAGLGWTEGYVQTAWWWPAHAHGLSLQYDASLYSSTDGARAAYGDARSSLWELGIPVMGRVERSQTVTVRERDGHTDAFLALVRGPVELELRLRYDRTARGATVSSGLWYLRHAAILALSRTTNLIASLPPGVTPSVAAEPGIYLAPWGTGPVVKSPSLLAPPALPAGTHLDGSAYRPPGGPPLMSRVAGHGTVLPPDGLSRYAEVGSAPSAAGWYDAVTLYSSNAAAENALSRMETANGKIRRLHLDPGVWGTGRLGTLDALVAWARPHEDVVAARLQNVVLTLTVSGMGTGDLPSVLNAQVGTIPTPLHAQGTQIVDTAGDPVQLSCLNWYGGEQNDFVVGGLDFRSYTDILGDIQRLGYTCIRLPFSNQLVEQNPTVTAHLGKNPELVGLHALDIMDRVVGYAGALGLSVILDDHRSEAGWSAEESGLWYTDAYPDAAFDRDWATMAQRYAVNDVVVGADLRNEPHGSATWGSGNPATDWQAAAERAGDAVLGVNPHLLVMVEGVQYYGSTGSYWWGGNLSGVQTAPVVLHFSDGSAARGQLVYSVHDYGPDNCQGGCPWFNAGTTYNTLVAIWQQYWGYITDDPTATYAAPVWVGEFGTCNYQASCVSDTVPGSQGQWFTSLLQYITVKHLGWAYWSVNGTESTAGERVYGALDWYGLFDKTWTTPYGTLNDALRTIQVSQRGAGTRFR